jgi:hypothetical protein
VLGAAARQRVVEHYTASAIAARTYEFWRTLVGQRKATASAS